MRPQHNLPRNSVFGPLATVVQRSHSCFQDLLTIVMTNRGISLIATIKLKYLSTKGIIKNTALAFFIAKTNYVLILIFLGVPFAIKADTVANTLTKHVTNNFANDLYKASSAQDFIHSLDLPIDSMEYSFSQKMRFFGQDIPLRIFQTHKRLDEVLGFFETQFNRSGMKLLKQQVTTQYGHSSWLLTSIQPQGQLVLKLEESYPLDSNQSSSSAVIGILSMADPRNLLQHWGSPKSDWVTSGSYVLTDLVHLNEEKDQQSLSKNHIVQASRQLYYINQHSVEFNRNFLLSIISKKGFNIEQQHHTKDHSLIYLAKNQTQATVWLRSIPNKPYTAVLLHIPVES